MAAPKRILQVAAVLKEEVAEILKREVTLDKRPF